MAWLFIDTHARGEFRVGWLSAGRVPTIRTYHGQTQGFLPRLIQAIKSAGRTWHGVCVVAGPGSFSAVRLGVLDANLLARLHEKPLIGVSVDQAEDLVQLTASLENGLFESSSYVSPHYDAEPNITLSRHQPT